MVELVFQELIERISWAKNCVPEVQKMGKMICSELDGCNGLDLSGFFLALVIALTLMLICTPPPRRPIVVVRRVW
ncbi:hypothetical protein RHMOL_Rhmol01G0371600 [Rhododendron molle]|uniref:Uncharacterized protein n=1 Tax=Rhododendron molle TaxID=49168 RepID=A0ACC0QCU9_RHOML|nr:hypothetical protein RHMOL_Rhmol01G0371600 [Rhododendron molle]